MKKFIFLLIFLCHCFPSRSQDIVIHHTDKTIYWFFGIFVSGLVYCLVLHQVIASAVKIGINNQKSLIDENLKNKLFNIDNILSNLLSEIEYYEQLKIEHKINYDKYVIKNKKRQIEKYYFLFKEANDKLVELRQEGNDLNERKLIVKKELMEKTYTHKQTLLLVELCKKQGVTDEIIESILNN